MAGWDTFEWKKLYPHKWTSEYVRICHEDQRIYDFPVCLTCNLKSIYTGDFCTIFGKRKKEVI
jgi:hypothetical protein